MSSWTYRALFYDCMVSSPEAASLQTQVVDLASDGNYVDPREMLNRVWTCSLLEAQTTLVPLMRPLFLGMLLVITVWFGAQRMFAGAIDWTSMIGWILTITLAGSMMTVYYSPTPFPTPFGQAHGVAHLITHGGIFIADEIFASGDDIFLDGFRDARQALDARQASVELMYADRAAATTRGGGSDGWFSRILEPVLRAWSIKATGVLVNLVQLVFLLLLWVIYWICMAQYLWGYVGIAVLSLLGPVFIPFILGAVRAVRAPGPRFRARARVVPPAVPARPLVTAPRWSPPAPQGSLRPPCRRTST